MDSGHIDPSEIPGGGSSKNNDPFKSQSTTSGGEKEAGWRMKKGNNIFELLLALVNFLGWKFKGEKDLGIVLDPNRISTNQEAIEALKQGMGTETYKIEGRIYPRYYSPVFWIHCLWAFVVHSRMLLTEAGRKRFKRYYNAFLCGQQHRIDYEISQGGSGTPNRIMLPLNSKRSKLWNRIRMNVIIYTRFDSYFIDVTDECDSDLDGDFSKFVLLGIFNRINDLIFYPVFMILDIPILAHEHYARKVPEKDCKGFFGRLKGVVGRRSAIIVYLILSTLIWSSVISLMFF